MALLEYLHGYACASFGIGQGMVMMLKTETTIRRDRVELIIRQTFQFLSGLSKCTKERIIGIVHLVHPETGFQATFIKTFIVGDKRQVPYQRFNLMPHLWKNGRMDRIVVGDAMNFHVPVAIVIRLRLDQTVKVIRNLTLPNNYHSHAANACTLFIGGFKIDGCKTVPYSNVIYTAKVRIISFSVKSSTK